MKKILLGDNHSVFRNGIKNIVSGQFNPVEFGDATNSAEVLHQITHAKWDLLILDINLPGRNGLDVLEYVGDKRILVPVLTFGFQDQIAVRAYQAGASAYLPRNVSDSELINAVQLLLNGRKYISPAVSELLLSRFENPDNRKPHELLSNREYQTLLLLGTGKSLSQAAEVLSVRVSSINTYRTRILEKMYMKSTADIIFYVVENKLI